MHVHRTTLRHLLRSTATLIPLPRSARHLASLPVAALVVVASIAFSHAARADERPTIIVLELKPQGKSVSSDVALTVGSLLPTYVGRDSRFKAQSGGEIRELVKLETEKSLAGCEDNSCLAELASALGARYVLFGNMGRLGNLTIINLAIFDQVSGEAISRETLQAQRLEELPAALEVAVNALLANLEVPTMTGTSTTAPDASSPALLANKDGAGAKRSPRDEFNDSVLVFNPQSAAIEGNVFNFLLPEVSAFQGQGSTPLSATEFYSTVGREEFASAYSIANTTRYAMIFGGSAAVGLGIVTFIGTVTAFGFDGVANPYKLPGGQLLFYAGVITTILLVAIGGAAVSWGTTLNPHPATANDRKRLIDDYNKGLRKRLGVERPARIRGVNALALNPQLRLDAE